MGALPTTKEFNVTNILSQAVPAYVLSEGDRVYVLKGHPLASAQWHCDGRDYTGVMEPAFLAFAEAWLYTVKKATSKKVVLTNGFCEHIIRQTDLAWHSWAYLRVTDDDEVRAALRAEQNAAVAAAKEHLQRELGVQNRLQNDDFIEVKNPVK